MNKQEKKQESVLERLRKKNEEKRKNDSCLKRWGECNCEACGYEFLASLNKRTRK